MIINFVKTHEDAILPKRTYDDKLTGDAGFDIFSIEEVTIPPGKSAIVQVGIEVGYITPGFWFKIEGRSGLAFKKEVDPHFGIIDNSYRGEFGVKLFNSSEDTHTLPKGYAVAQMIVHRMIDCTVNWQEEHSPGERGKNGFGSSDLALEVIEEPKKEKSVKKDFSSETKKI